MVISNREIARAKIERLKKGFSAYCESNEVLELMERYIKEEKLDVIIDRTPLGYWFIPNKEK
jgi:hypothetical protein